jgi:CDP-glycerol glycerophosphotransferase (TagB/SpsB family)
LISKPWLDTQHGVALFLKSRVDNMKKVAWSAEYIITSNKLETQLFSEFLGYRNDQLLQYGLARWSKLIEPHKPNRDILFMPTWREELRDLSQNEFVRSHYYTKIDSLLKSPGLNLFLAKNNLYLKVFIHPILRKFLQGRDNLNKNRIEIVSNSDAARLLPEMIHNAKLVISDYSSVTIDFFIQGKPVVLFNLDNSINIENLYISRPELKFYDFANNIEDLIKILDRYNQTNYKTSSNVEKKLSQSLNEISKNPVDRTLKFIHSDQFLKGGMRARVTWEDVKRKQVERKLATKNN